MEDEVILTPDGYRRLNEELDFLTHQRRREVAERIKESIQFGDLTENSEYDDAKNEQAFVEARISHIVDLVSKAKVIEKKSVKTGAVDVGCRVKLRDQQSSEEDEYLIVGSAEADPMNHRISNESPVGKAIIGQKAGEVVSVETPEGKLKYLIVAIKK